MAQSGIDVYLDQVASRLTGTRREKEKTMGEIRELLWETPGIEAMTAEQVFGLFDPPWELAEEYRRRREERDREREKRSKRRFRTAVIAIAVITGLLVIILLAAYTINGYLFTQSQMQEPDRLSLMTTGAPWIGRACLTARRL